MKLIKCIVRPNKVDEVKDALDKIGKLREQIVATLQNVRRLAVELRPSALDDFGLAPALERLVH